MMYGPMILVLFCNILKIATNIWVKLETNGENVPPGLEDASATLAETDSSRIIYVFGGRYRSRYGYIVSRSLFSYNLGR